MIISYEWYFKIIIIIIIVVIIITITITIMLIFFHLFFFVKVYLSIPVSFVQLESIWTEALWIFDCSFARDIFKRENQSAILFKKIYTIQPILAKIIILIIKYNYYNILIHMLIFCTAVVSLGVSRAPLKRGTAATHPILCRSHEKEYTLFTLLSAGLLKTVGWSEGGKRGWKKKTHLSKTYNSTA